MQNVASINVCSARVTGFRSERHVKKSVVPQRATRSRSRAFTVRAVDAEDIERKKKEAQEKMKNLMRNTQTPLSEVAKPSEGSSFDRYSMMTPGEIAGEVARKKAEVDQKRAEKLVQDKSVAKEQFQKTIDEAPEKSETAKEEAQKRIKEMMSGKAKVDPSVGWEKPPYKSPAELEEEMERFKVDGNQSDESFF